MLSHTADIIWGRRLFNGELCVFQLPDPPAPKPNIQPMPFDPTAPPKRVKRARRRQPIPDEAALRREFLQNCLKHLEMLQTLRDVVNESWLERP